MKYPGNIVTNKVRYFGSGAVWISVSYSIRESTYTSIDHLIECPVWRSVGWTVRDFMFDYIEETNL